MKKNFMMITLFLRKCTTTVIGKRNQDAVYCVKLSRAQDQGLQFWQTKSHMQPLSAVFRQQIASIEFFSQNGIRKMFERLSTPRRTPQVTLKSSWHSQQQQSICEDVTCTRKFVHDRTEMRDVRGNPTDDQTRTRRLVQEFEPIVEKPQFEIDLRVEGVSQDAILQDEAKMNEINEMFEKLKVGSRTKSVRDDLSKGNMIFSEESSQAIYEMCNMELIELKQTSATIQCSSCVKHVLEDMNMCQCGVWLRPNQNTLDRIREAFTALKSPYFRTRDVIFSGHNPCQKDHHKAMDAKKRRTKTRQIHLYTGPMAKKTKYTERLRQRSDGRRRMSSTTITSPRLTLHLSSNEYDFTPPST